MVFRASKLLLLKLSLNNGVLADHAEKDVLLRKQVDLQRVQRGLSLHFLSLLRLRFDPPCQYLKDQRLCVPRLLAGLTRVYDGHFKRHLGNSLIPFSLERVKFFQLLEVGVLEGEVAERGGFVVRHAEVR